MAELNILSWNVQKFGEKKAKEALGFIAAVLKRYEVNLVMFLETTKHAQAAIVHDLLDLLGGDWMPVTSEETGKAVKLPEEIPFDKFNKNVDRHEYEKTLVKCYDVVYRNKKHILKDNYTEGDAHDVRGALIRAGVALHAVETYTGLVKCDLSANHYYWIPGTRVGISPLATALRSTDDNDRELGYQDPTSVFNGRMPFVVQMVCSRPSRPLSPERWFPLVAFHAPFGNREEPRIPAIHRLLDVGTANRDNTARTKIRHCETAIVMGDFNVNYDARADYTNLPTPIPNTYSPSRRAYGPFVQAGFTIQVKEASSLKEPAKVDPNTTNSKDFRNLAYDNIITKGIDRNAVAFAGVLDLIADIYTESKTGGYLYGVVQETIPSLYDAFKYYRDSISDHLPVLIKIKVDDRT